MNIDDLNPEISIGRTCHGFRVLRCERTRFLDLVFYEMEHEKTGAKYIHLSSSDTNNVFSVAFRTLPDNSTGLGHILEHAVLEGSERYPVKIFKNLPGRSVNTFLNAMTGPDYTAYPFSSRNRKDFFNILDLFLDAVFFPQLKRETFLQEGWRFEFADAEDPCSPLEYKGVVYNEMKGAMSNPVRLFYESVKQAMFPDLIYSNVSGGTPQAIPDLTYEDWKNYHSIFYHPSNSYFFSYGSFSLAGILGHIQERFLAKFERQLPPGPIPIQKSYEAPIVFRRTFPVSSTENTDKKTIAAVAWKLAHITDFYENLKLMLLALVLSGDSTSILNRELLSSGLGYGLAPIDFDNSFSESYFGIGLKDIRLDDFRKVESLILKLLRKIAEKGVPEEDIEAALHQIEFSSREIKGNRYLPFGLTLIMRAKNLFMHGGDFLDTLKMDKHIRKLRTEFNNGTSFKKLITQYFIENPHRATIVLEPEKGGDESVEAALRNKLDRVQAGMTRQEKQRIVNQAQELHIHQNSEGDVSCLPHIDLADLPVTPEYIPETQSDYRGVPFYHHSLDTNGIDYLILGFNVPMTTGLPSSSLGLINMLASLGAGGDSYIEMGRKIKACTGGIGFKVHPYIHFPTDQLYFSFSLSGQCLNANFSRMIELMEAILFELDLDDRRRISELLGAKRAYALPLAGANGHYMAGLAAARRLSRNSRILHGLDGLGYIQYLLDEKSAETEVLRAEFAVYLAGMLGTERLCTGLTGIHKEMEFYYSKLDSILNRLPDQPRNALISDNGMPESTGPEAWIISTEVSYVARVYSAVNMRHPDSAILAILAELMELPLYSLIRAKGGAYGAFANYNPDAAVFSFLTFRDPHTAYSLDAFQQVIDKIASGGYSDKDLEQAIIETIRKRDIPGSPREKGMIQFSRTIRGITNDDLANYRTVVLNVTRADIDRVVQTYMGSGAESSIAILTSDNILANSETSKLDLKRIQLNR